MQFYQKFFIRKIFGKKFLNFWAKYKNVKMISEKILNNAEIWRKVLEISRKFAKIANNFRKVLKKSSEKFWIYIENLSDPGKFKRSDNILNKTGTNFENSF